MACKDCAERRKKLRDAIMHGKFADALGMSVEGLREMIGLSAQGEVLIDPSILPSLSGKTKPELLEVAAGEGVVLEDGATNAEIVEAIEARRALVTA